MPLLDISTAQSCFQSSVRICRSPTQFPITFNHGNEGGLAFRWKYSYVPGKANIFSLGRNKAWRCRLIINAVATLELKRSSQGNHEEYQNLPKDLIPSSSSLPPVEGEHLYSSDEDSKELDERERLRRMRISKANKGNTPWNKGRKHSPETLQRIRERTRLAMQNPKVKMKLVNLGHAQSEETRMKIGVGVRMGWERRREKLMLQETCHYEWQNLIAEASRRGLYGEEELQWDSYKLLDEELEKEWLQSVEERRKMRRPKGSKRAPKSAEQRKKISQAIAAKWADPAYRTRVCSGLAKYHGIPEGIERKPRRKPNGDEQTRRSESSKRDGTVDTTKHEQKRQMSRVRLKKNNTPLYKDPLASSKLEMLKNIRAKRMAAETKKSDAIERAKTLIAEAEKAAKALEIAAKTSPVAQASLIETRKLIAEAVQSLKSIGGHEGPREQGESLPESPTGHTSHVEDTDIEAEGCNQIGRTKINGFQSLTPGNTGIRDLNLGNSSLENLVNGKGEVLTSNRYDLLNAEKSLHDMSSSDYVLAQPDLDDMIERSSLVEHCDEPGFVENEEQPELVKQFGTPGHVESEEPGQPPLPEEGKSRSDKDEGQSKSATITKKWVRGRLVEVHEGP